MDDPTIIFIWLMKTCIICGLSADDDCYWGVQSV